MSIIRSTISWAQACNLCKLPLIVHILNDMISYDFSRRRFPRRRLDFFQPFTNIFNHLQLTSFRTFGKKGVNYV